MRHKSDDITSPPGEVGFGWNEIQFLEWDELLRMAPSIVGLEVRRLSSAAEQLEPGTELYNMLVGARFELKQFLQSLGVEETGGGAERRSATDDRESAARHLESALICLGLCQKSAEGDVLGVVEYATDRMSHILERMKLLYR
ncbi:MAG: hypothetical protein KJO98_06825 [Rhodothermia bacterium]|nr:hypothetical protein [Rhodothermia bacterium]